MVCKISILLIAAVICFTWVEAIPFHNFVKNGCGPNEYYVGPNNDCEPSCIEPQPIICSKFGGLCYCNQGYLRNPYGDCVVNAKCPNKLPPSKIVWPEKYTGRKI